MWPIFRGPAVMWRSARQRPVRRAKARSPRQRRPRSNVSSRALVGIVGVGQGLPGDEEVVGAGRATGLGQGLGVRHGDAEPGVQLVVADLGDRAESTVDGAAAEVGRRSGAELVLGLEA